MLSLRVEPRETIFRKKGPMPKQNITLSIDKDLIRQARQLSARKTTSVSKLLSEELERMVRDHKQYEYAK